MNNLFNGLGGGNGGNQYPDQNYGFNGSQPPQYGGGGYPPSQPPVAYDPYATNQPQYGAPPAPYGGVPQQYGAPAYGGGPAQHCQQPPMQAPYGGGGYMPQTHYGGSGGSHKRDSSSSSSSSSSDDEKRKNKHNTHAAAYGGGYGGAGGYGMGGMGGGGGHKTKKSGGFLKKFDKDGDGHITENDFVLALRQKGKLASIGIYIFNFCFFCLKMENSILNHFKLNLKKLVLRTVRIYPNSKFSNKLAFKII